MKKPANAGFFMGAHNETGVLAAEAFGPVVLPGSGGQTGRACRKTMRYISGIRV